MKNMIKLIPNSITILRIIMSIIFIYFVIIQFEYGKRELINLIIMFLAICPSDLLDGRIARKMRCVSKTGAKLDVLADLLYILLSYITMIILKILPIWFLCFVSFKFIEFVMTSNFINKHNKLSKDPFVFDKIGRIVSVMFFIIPSITCIYKGLVHYNAIYLVNSLLCIVFVAGIYSSYLRIKSCFIVAALKT